MEVVRADNVRKCYGAGAGATEAVHQVSLSVAAGEFVALMGPSGCGKTTLLNLLGAMDLPTSGTVWLDGRNTSELDDNALTALRRQRVGFVFQAFHLLPTLTVAENIEMPLLLLRDLDARAARIAALAERVGLGNKLRAFPGELSGGEMQRAAIARALIHRPRLVIADEPTGNLDSQSAARVLDLMAELSREAGAAVVMATHSRDAAAYASRVVHLRDGAIDLP
ncbi:MAG TPA: ABC transporter ATP-binding protein [Terriglobales bacterium]|nr:ABC transporter ATP-binding protein [Terriglobales bacterium]